MLWKLIGLAAAAEEEVGWDEDSDEDEEEDDSDDDSEEDSSDDETVPATKAPATDKRPGSQGSSTTIQPKPNTLKPSEPRKSNDEKSQADSEASYDVVGARSGVPSQAPNSPKDGRKDGDSDDEDWE